MMVCAFCMIYDKNAAWLHVPIQDVVYENIRAIYFVIYQNIYITTNQSRYHIYLKVWFKTEYWLPVTCRLEKYELIYFVKVKVRLCTTLFSLKWVGFTVNRWKMKTWQCLQVPCFHWSESVLLSTGETWKPDNVYKCLIVTKVKKNTQFLAFASHWFDKCFGLAKINKNIASFALWICRNSRLSFFIQKIEYWYKPRARHIACYTRLYYAVRMWR